MKLLEYSVTTGCVAYIFFSVCAPKVGSCHVTRYVEYNNALDFTRQSYTFSITLNGEEKARINVEYVYVYVCVLMLQLGGLLPLLTTFPTAVHVSDKGCGPGGTSGAPHGTALRHVDLLYWLSVPE